MISIIAAVAKDRAIGYENKLIYWLPNDLKRFKARIAQGSLGSLHAHGGRLYHWWCQCL